MNSRRNPARQIICGLAGILFWNPTNLDADLLGYFSADATEGTTNLLINDLMPDFLLGSLEGGAVYTDDADGHTGQPGDYAIEFPGLDDDYAVIPPTDLTFDEFTFTAWIKGTPAGDWAAVISSRDSSQPMYLGFTGGTTDLAYVWNDNSNQTWGWASGLTVPPDQWTFVGMTIQEELAVLFMGPEGEPLEFATNIIPHTPQTNVTEWRLSEDDGFGGSRNFEGLIDDVSIWDEALDPTLLEALQTRQIDPLTLFLGPPDSDCDFDGSGTCDLVDLNELLYTGLANGGSKYDLDGSGGVDLADRDEFIRQIETFPGDFDLNGEVAASDLNILGTNWQLGDRTSYDQGDANGDGVVNANDLNVVGSNWQQGVAAPANATVPEPSGSILAVIGLLGWLAVKRGQARRN